MGWGAALVDDTGLVVYPVDVCSVIKVQVAEGTAPVCFALWGFGVYMMLGGGGDTHDTLYHLCWAVSRIRRSQRPFLSG